MMKFADWGPIDYPRLCAEAYSGLPNQRLNRYAIKIFSPSQILDSLRTGYAAAAIGG